MTTKEKHELAGTLLGRYACELNKATSDYLAAVEKISLLVADCHLDKRTAMTILDLLQKDYIAKLNHIWGKKKQAEDVPVPFKYHSL